MKRPSFTTKVILKAHQVAANYNGLGVEWEMPGNEEGAAGLVALVSSDPLHTWYHMVSFTWYGMVDK